MKIPVLCVGLGLSGVLAFAGDAAALTPTPSPAPTLTPPPVELAIPPSAVTASTTDRPHVAANVVDNNLGTRWSGYGDGATLRIDLGVPRMLALVKIAVFEGDRRRNKFDLEVSDNGTTWTPVFKGESSGSTLAEETYDFPDRFARYIRYVGHGSTVSRWNSVTEISVFSPGRPRPTCHVTPGAFFIHPGQSIDVRGICNLGLVGYTLHVIDLATGLPQSESDPIFTPARPAPIQVPSGGVNWRVTAVRSGQVVFRLGAYGEFFDPTCQCWYFTNGSATSGTVRVP